MTALVNIYGSVKPMSPDAVDRLRSLHQNTVAAETSEVDSYKAFRKAEVIALKYRCDLGRELLALRSCWPSRGPHAKGWGDFLAAVGISQDSALRYMAIEKGNDPTTRIPGSPFPAAVREIFSTEVAP